MKRRLLRFASLCALLAAGNAGLVRAETTVKFTADQDHASLVKEEPGPPAPPATPVSAEKPSAVQLALSVYDANRALVASAEALDLSSASPDALDSIVDQSVWFSDKAFKLIPAAARFHDLRLQFEKTGKIADAAQAINEIVAVLQQAPANPDDVTAYLATLRQQAGDSFKPGSEILLADLALVVGFNNVAFIKCRLYAQELYPLALEVNAAAAKKGVKGIDAKTVQFLRARAERDDLREEWARFDQNVRDGLKDATPNFKAKADEILSHEVYNRPVAQ